MRVWRRKSSGGFRLLSFNSLKNWRNSLRFQVRKGENSPAPGRLKACKTCTPSGKSRLLHVFDAILLGGKKVWEKWKVLCPITSEWLTFWVSHKLQGNDTQQKAFLVKYKEHRFTARRGRIALLIFQTMPLNFPTNCQLELQWTVWENENCNCSFSSDTIPLKRD